MRARILGIAGVLLVLGFLPFVLGRPEPSESVARRALGRVSFDAGLVAARSGDFESAATALRRAIDLDPGHLNAYLEWSDVLKQLGRQHVALRVLHDLHARSPTDPSLAFLEAYTRGDHMLGHKAQGSPGAALRACDRMAEQPLPCEALKGRVALEEGNFEAAVAAFERALSGRSSRATRVSAHLGLIEAQLRAGLPDDARHTASAAWRELEETVDNPGLLELSSLRYATRRWTSSRATDSRVIEEMEAEARRGFQQACESAREFLRVACLLDQVQEYRMEGRHAKALTTSYLALEVIRGRDAPLLVGRLLTLRCEMAATIGRFDDALPDCNAASTLYLEHGAMAHALAPLEWTVHVHQSRGEIQAGFDAARRYLELARQGGTGRDVVGSLSAFGWLAFQAGRTEEAHAALRDLEAYADSSGKWSKEVARFHEVLGDYRTALARYHAVVRDSATGSWAESERMGALDGLARTYLALGDIDEAERFASAYFERYRSIEDRTDLPVPNLPEVLAAGGRWTEALGAARLVLQIARSVDDPRLAARAREEVVRVQLAAGRYSEAVDELSSLLEEYDRLGLFWERGRTLIALADARIQLHDLEGGFAALAEARAHGAVTRDHEIEWRTVYLEGRIFELRGEPRPALASYRRAIRDLESLRLLLPQGALRSAYLTGRLDPYEAAIHLLLAGDPSTDSVGEAFLLSEAKKARTLRDRGSGRRSSVPTVAGLLHDDEALIEFTFVRDTLWAFVVRQDRTEAVRLPATRSRIGESVRELRAPLEGLEEGRITITQAKWPVGASKRLFDVLIRPLEPLLREVRTVLLVPEDELWLVPFDALVTGSRERATPAREPLLFQEYEELAFLADRYAFAYLPSAEWLHSRPEHLSSLSGLLAIGDPQSGVGRPLPASRTEAFRVAALVPGSVVLSGREASEASFLEMAPRHRFLHVAAHSVADPASPTSSGLALAPDSVSDGFVSALDLSRLRLDADMVVLSACRTATGPVRRGEGVMALSRSFLGAGARSVVATQWSIPDAAGGVMPRFYRGLMEGGDVVQELRRAKLLFRHSVIEGADGQRISAAHPIYWAPFILVGYPRLTLGSDEGNSPAQR